MSSHSEDWGSFGAFVSGIAGTAIALATLVALAVTFALQARELENSRHAVERQIFDNTFFQLLQRFNGIVSSLAIEVPMLVVHRHITGRRLVERIYKEMRDKYPISPPGEQLEAIVDMHRAVYPKYEPELGPYFRTLYHVFKFIENATLTEPEKIAYADIARAQLSRFELALLFYNGLTPYGEKFKPLIEKYGILKHVNPADLANLQHLTNRTLYVQTAFMSEKQRAETGRHRG